MATLKDAFLTSSIQQYFQPMHPEWNENEEEDEEEYKNFIDNTETIGKDITNDDMGEEDEEYRYTTENNTPNFVNNEYFNNIINNDNENSLEELQEPEDYETYYYNNDSNDSDGEENTSFNHLELEGEHSDSEEEETKPKEQRSFHMYIPKTLTPKSKQSYQSGNESSQSIITTYQPNTSSLNSAKITNVEEIPIPHRSESKQSSPKSTTTSPNSYENEYKDDEESSIKFKMLKRNSRWGNLLNKISKPGTYVPPTNKHSKEAILKSKSQDTAQKTEQKQDVPLKTSLSNQRKNEPLKKQPDTKKIEKPTKTESPQVVKTLQSLPKEQQVINNQESKQEKTLKAYFSEPSIPNDLFLEEDSINQEDEEGWGTFINRNNVYNPYNYEQKPITSQKTNQQPPNDEDPHKAKISNSRSIISNFFLPKSQEEEKKRQIKEKIEKKKEDKKLKEQEELKLQELEEQLIFYKNENEKTRRLKDELQAERQNIECEKSEFKRFTEEEREKFEKYKQEETQKLKRERRILERNIKDQQQSLSRKEHEKEVNDLKEKIEKLTTEFKNERSKLKSNIQALKSRNEQLQEKIIELEENLKKRELERIDNNFRKKQSKDNISQPSINSSPSITTNTKVNSQQNPKTPITPNKDVNIKPLPETMSTKVMEKIPLVKSLYPNNHKLGLLKKTFQVSDSHFNVTWENENFGEVVTSRREVGKGKIEILFNTGRRDVEFSNGSVKKILPDRSSLIYFNNGDIKKTFEDGLVIYFFNNLKTTQITYPTGAEMYKFSNNQIETHFPGGEKEVVFPDKTIKFVDNNGSEEIWFSDGTYSRNDPNN
ncbi:predicted protein [Naegleria gruberi]|uniref:Predicted protein n=1 Tax=Naegleria gruberi TaxID=5762 RepID=D2UXF7_NAEGR|nr:uncharacterized protein NAEGRDRAFT_61107 [Naegleria gruberi]EFC50625.1 predicted protein [Naegleria gruberi]|eukprot:XP_002683369.1 predicted protein [Naegleria gruberi strain NEG-M]